MPQPVKKYDKPVKYYGKRERLSYGKIPEIMDLPDLIEVQKSSYEEFLQRQILPNNPLIGRVIATPVEHPTTGDVLLETNTELTKEQIDELLKADISDVEVSHEHKTERVSLREDKGLQAVLNEIFPIPDFSETNELRFVSYSLGVPKYDINECQSRGFSYALPVKVRVRLVLREKDEDTGENLPTEEIIENEVYMGEIPLMTENGTFIINGSERVIVSQLQRSPGATFGEEAHTSGQTLNTARIIPYRGAWIEFEYDIKDLIYVRLDRRKKMLVTVLLRALGWETDETILKLYAKTEQVKLDKSLIDRVTAAPIRHPCH